MTAGRGLVLVGLRGVGKTTVGSLVAHNLSLPFVDTDDLVEQARSQSIADIFREYGEETFRDAEALAIASLDLQTVQVVATGGGAVLRCENRQRLKELGLVIWLRADALTLRARLVGSDRPPLTDTPIHLEVEEVLRNRKPLYEDVADRIVDVEERTVEEISDELQQLWRNPPHHDLR